MNIFTSLSNEDVEIIDLNYSLSIAITENIDISEMSGCLSSVFNVVEKSLKKGIEMRYKMVSNYDEMDAKDAYIIESYNKGMGLNSIELGIVDIFKMTLEEAREVILAKIADFEMERNGGSKQLRIKNNPGFLVIIEQEPFSNKVLITLTNVSNIKYIDILKVYIHFIISVSKEINIE